MTHLSTIHNVMYKYIMPIIIVMLLSDVKILSIELVAVSKHHHKMNIGFLQKHLKFLIKNMEIVLNLIDVQFQL